MTIREVKEFIAEKFGLEVSYDTVYRWLRVKMKLPYGKPFTVDKRRPNNAEEMLADNLREELKGEGEVIISLHGRIQLLLLTLNCQSFQPR